MSKPTTVIDPLYNAKLLTNLDCANLQLVNLDTSNLVGLGGSGNDTGTTTAILKGDGNHGFANAVADTDYATVGLLTTKEDQTTHDADITTLTVDIGTINTDIATINASLALKASTAALTAGLALKADDTALQAYITSNDSALASLTTAVGNKADSSSVSSALAGKEPLLPTTVNDRYILARRNSSGTDAWFFVDPVTLGTTSQSFTDGVENSSTTFVSATANFVAGDVGKTITGDNIPAATTIASRTNSTTIVLSQAATATGSSKNFTILNRLVVGGTGTVTSVGATNNVTELFSATVTNPTSSATITFDPSSSVGANRFYGNFTGFAGTAAFGTASAARASLGGTTAGQALFQVTNPTAISFPQFTAINGVITRTPAQVLGDIGAESALTFSTPLLRSVSPPNVISIQTASTLLTGALSNSDWTTFNGKLAPGRLITTTAPLRIDGLPSANLTADRTLSMAAAASTTTGTGQVDGYLKGSDFFTFLDKPPNSRTIGTVAPLAIGGVAGASLDLTANRTISMLSATAARDGYLTKENFAAFAAGSPQTVTVNVTSGTFTINSLAPPVTRVMITQALTGTLSITLPGAINYNVGGGFPFLEFVDTVPGGAMASFGITFVAATVGTGTGQDLLDGATTYSVPRGSGYLRLNSNGFDRWTTTKYVVAAFQDPVAPTKKVLVDVSLQPASANFSFIPTTVGSGGTVPQTDVITDKYLTGFDLPNTVAGTSGQFKASTVTPTNLTRVQDDVTSAEIIAGNNTYTVAAGTDTVRLTGSLTAPLTIVWPAASGYKAGMSIRFRDATGSISKTNTVTIVQSVSSGDTFNGGATFYVINQPFAVGNFIVDQTGSPGFWLVEGFSVPTSGLPAFVSSLTEDGTAHTLTWNCTKGETVQTAIASPTGSDALLINGPDPGMKFELMFIQPGAGGKTITFPTGSQTPARIVTDGVTNTTTTVTSATALFTPDDVGKVISSGNSDITAGTKITAFTSSTTVTIGVAATGSHTGVTLTIGGKGVLVPAQGANAITKISGTYYGVTGANWFWEILGSNYSIPDVVTYNTGQDTVPNPWTTGNHIALTASDRVYISLGGPFNPGATAVIGRVDVPILKIGNPTGNLSVHVFNAIPLVAPATSGYPGTEIAASGVVLPSAVTAIAGTTPTAGEITAANAAPFSFFFSMPPSLANGINYYMALASSTSVNVSNAYFVIGNSGAGNANAIKISSANPVADQIANGGTWKNLGEQWKFNFKTYKQ